jgi:hypothetical protein
MSGSILHLVLETPGCDSLDILRKGTEDDSPPPLFALPPELSYPQLGSLPLAFDKETGSFDLSLEDLSNFEETFFYLSHQVDLADQIEATIQFLEQNETLQMGKFLLFLNAPLLLAPPSDFLDWLDAVAHFTDCMLFTGRNNENSSAIKTIQDRYLDMRFPMESFILGKKSAPWSRILDPTARRLSHVFDSPDLLEAEELPINDRYLERLSTGERARGVPMLFKH